MICGRTTFLTAALAAAVFISAGAETPEEEIDRNIAKLGAEKYEDRLVAEATLREIGPEAALRYDPATDGADPEVAMRMKELLVEWKVVEEAASLPSPGRARLAPWVPLDALPWHKLKHLDDDRLQDWLRARAEGDEEARSQLLAIQARHPSMADIRRYLERDREETVFLLAGRRKLVLDAGMKDEVRAAAKSMAGGDGVSAAAACVLLVKLGDPPEEARRAIREGRAVLPALGSLNSIRSVCVAVGSLPDAWTIEGASWFPAAEFVSYYIQERDADSLAQLPSEFAEVALRLLLEPKRIDFRASVYLNALGHRVPGLEQVSFDNVRDAHRGPGPTFAEALERAAPFMPGARVEASLRSLIERAETDCASVLLRALAARGRERDITFIYVKLKALPPAYQPEVAVALAKLGSAAGIGLLVRHLTGLDPETADASADAIRRITGRDFGFDAGDDLPTRCRAARAAARWWEENKRTFHPDADKIGK